MPSDPILNEQLLLRHLRDSSYLTPTMMRSLCTLSLLGCYDRKVTREFFIEMLDLVQSIHMDLSDMERAGTMRGFLTNQDPQRPVTVLDEAIDKLAAGFKCKRLQLADKMDLVSQCPTTADPIS